MKVIYIAGPFRAATAWGIEQNIREAEALGLRIAGFGAMPMIPHANTRFFHGLLDDAFWIEGTCELLLRCDAVAFTERGASSEGARGERLAAQEHKMPLFYAPDLSGLESYLSAP